jgi:hypothetical protein
MTNYRHSEADLSAEESSWHYIEGYPVFTNVSQKLITAEMIKFHSDLKNFFSIFFYKKSQKNWL